MSALFLALLACLAVMTAADSGSGSAPHTGTQATHTERTDYRPHTASVHESVHTQTQNSRQEVSFTRGSTRFTYTETTCSAPPSSIEICLTQVFSTMETALVSVYRTLKSHEVSIESQVRSEQLMLSNEVSLIRIVGSIASSVRSYVNIEYANLRLQVSELRYEKLQIYEAYKYVEAKLQLIFQEVTEVEAQEAIIYAEYEKIQAEKWSVYSYISAIIYERQVVYKEVAEIYYVVNYLKVQITKIEQKIYQLVKRQKWLQQWEYTLYESLEHFQKYVREFKSVQKYIRVEELALEQEQVRLNQEALNLQTALTNLYAEYEVLSYYLKELVEYEQRIELIQKYVSGEASVFISLYGKFTCQDELLYYEACSKSHANTAAPAGPPAPTR